MDIIAISNIHILVCFSSCNMAMVESCMVNLHLGREQPLHAQNICVLVAWMEANRSIYTHLEKKKSYDQAFGHGL
jgi:hypothetical protein